MPEIPAVCNNCGSFYPSGTGFDAGNTGVTVTLTVPTRPASRPCPVCGGNGRRLGGAWDIVENTIRLLEGPERTVSELERLAGILREAQERGANLEEVRSSVEREFPGWGQQLAKLLVPKTPSDLAAYLMLILMVIQMASQAKQTDGPVHIEADQVINNITVQTPAPPTPPPTTTTNRGINPSSEQYGTGRRVGRNDPCPCGSGLKYKRCHGARGQTRYAGP